MANKEIVVTLQALSGNFSMAPNSRLFEIGGCRLKKHHRNTIRQMNCGLCLCSAYYLNANAQLTI